MYITLMQNNNAFERDDSLLNTCQYRRKVLRYSRRKFEIMLKLHLIRCYFISLTFRERS